MRLLALITLLIFSSFRFPDADEIIEWREGRLLSWDDFRGKPAKRFSAASTTYDILKSIREKDKSSSIVNIRAVFFPNKSWKKTSWVNNSVLIHEQKHFDIAELFARQLRQRIGQLRYTSFENLKVKTDSLYDVVDKEMDIYQDRYDEETESSMNGDKQREWNKKIKDEIDNLNAYAASELIIQYK